MSYSIRLGHAHFSWPDLKTLMAHATPLRSGDMLAGLAATNAQERVAAQKCLSDVPLRRFLEEHLIAPEVDEVTRLILETHNPTAFAPVANLSVGEFRNFLLRYETDSQVLQNLAPGLTPEMVAAVSKICGNQDLILIASKCRVVTRFRGTIGLPGRLSTRLQPNHPTDDARGVAASVLDGLLMGSGDAVIGINPASDSVAAIDSLLYLLADLIEGFQIPTQSCVLTHVTTQIAAIERGLPVDLVFQSIAGTQGANSSFGINLKMLEEAFEAARTLGRGSVGNNAMYFETGQGACLSANAHHGVDQQTLEARAYAVARRFEPLLVNTVVGFIGPEYLYNGKQIIRAGLEDHFCGKLLGVPMGCDICYTNHAEADQDDMDSLLVLLGAAGCNFIMGVPGADDIMLGYQSTSFHDAQFLRQTLGLKPAPEFDCWLRERGVTDSNDQVQGIEEVAKRFAITAPESTMALLPIQDSSPESLAHSWKQFTPARLALPRAGASIATEERLDFHLCHANARDAVHWPFDRKTIYHRLQREGFQTQLLTSDAHSRADFLQRPDWGRRLSPRSRNEWQTIAETHGNCDISIIISDGLSALAVERHAAPLLEKLKPFFDERAWKIAPVALVSNGRVALQDEIGEIMATPLSLILIGERPGLGVPDSLSAYLVHGPRVGNTDERRNCISNIRPDGLPLDFAAQKLNYLLGEMRLRGLSGVALKDESGLLAPT
ncbi:ethanolamine ammonia-lyase [bacterium]|nr:MAG: ethanolamine ammonia-lyase [bacterium]